MILNWICAGLALLSLGLLLWQWFVAWRFPLHRRVIDGSFAPPVTLLKSLKGADAATEECLRSWFVQEYAGEIQILFGVADGQDPVCKIVRQLMRDYPSRDAQLIVCGPLIGANAKVSKLAELEKLAKHEVLAISDADVRVPPDFLTNVVAPLRTHQKPVLREGQGIPNKNAPPLPDPLLHYMEEREKIEQTAGLETNSAREPANVASSVSPTSKPDAAAPAAELPTGLVNCFYCLANPATFAMQWEAVAINADFWSQVLQSRSIKPLDFALGAVMVTRRKQLEEIGGFEALADCLADDYQLGNRIARKGYRIEICPVVVECWDPPMTWRDVWKHQLRWARTIRVCQPVPYFFSILSNVTLWALIWFVVVLAGTDVRASGLFSNASLDTISVVTGFPIGVIGSAACCVIRMWLGFDLQRRLTRSLDHAVHGWLIPIKDLLQAVIWVCAFAGNRVEWRGQRFRLRRDGNLEKLQDSRIAGGAPGA